MNTDKDTIRRDRNALVQSLTQAGAVFKGNGCTCPFHDDRHPSMGLYADDDGIWRAKCQAASCGFLGDVYDVQAKVEGTTPEELLREQKRDATQPRKLQPRRFESGDELDASMSNVRMKYTYTDPETGHADLIVYRIEDGGRKRFLQAHQNGRGFVLSAPPKPWPIYNRKRVGMADEVVVVEGEKCVHALHDIGIVATTSPAGAGKAEHADWSPLAGKTAYLWPDCDEPDPKTGKRSGIEHMRQVADMLDKLDPPCRVLWVDVDELGLGPKDDVVDFVASMADEDTESKRLAVESVLSCAMPLGAASEVGQLVEDIISGKRRAIEWPWETLSALTRALLPGTVTILVGDPGCSKSFGLLQAAAYWHDQGIPVAIFELEEDRKYHLFRAMAQRVAEPNLFDDGWVVRNADLVREHFNASRGFLDSFGRCIYEAPDKQVTLDELAEWVADRAREGKRIICIDPITAAQATEKPWVADLKFLIQAKTTVRDYGASLIIVTHPKLGQKKDITLDHLAGSAAYGRFVQTAIAIQTHEPPACESIRIPGFNGRRVGAERTFNRSIHIRKARNGPGGGARLAFDFDSRLTFQEHGVVMEDIEQ